MRGLSPAAPIFVRTANVYTAATICSCTSPFVRQVAPSATNVPALIEITDQNARDGAIDATSNLATHKIWMFSGTKDTLVKLPVMKDLETYYRHYINSPTNIYFKQDIGAEHAMPTDFFGNACHQLTPPFINNCYFDAASELLKWIYGNLNLKNTGTLSGKFVEFDQSEFFDDHNPTAHGMANSGFLYVPANCDRSLNQLCRLHAVFHGCLQDPTLIQDKFYKNTGYNQWADANNIIVLYPQVAKILPKNPNACWDWWGYDDENYAKKSGRQMVAVKEMVDRITVVAVSSFFATRDVLYGDQFRSRTSRQSA